VTLAADALNNPAALDGYGFLHPAHLQRSNCGDGMARGRCRREP